jgi:hypothetical protein
VPERCVMYVEPDLFDEHRVEPENPATTTRHA